jgi:hypothetical protein
MLSAADALGPVQSMERVQARRQGDFDNPIGLPFTYFLFCRDRTLTTTVQRPPRTAVAASFLHINTVRSQATRKCCA